MAAVTVRGDFGAKENKHCHCFHFSPSICQEVMGLDANDLLNGEFQTSFFTLLFHPPHKLFSSSSLSAIRVVSVYTTDVIQTSYTAMLSLGFHFYKMSIRIYLKVRRA